MLGVRVAPRKLSSLEYDHFLESIDADFDDRVGRLPLSDDRERQGRVVFANNGSDWVGNTGPLLPIYAKKIGK